jgi:hypothetical protein
MSRQENPHLSQELLRHSRPTSPEELLESGARKLRRVELGVLHRLVERAINHSILERTLGLSDHEEIELTEAARKELWRSLRERQQVEAVRDRLRDGHPGLGEETAELREDLRRHHEGHHLGGADEDSERATSEIAAHLEGTLRARIDELAAEIGNGEAVRRAGLDLRFSAREAVANARAETAARYRREIELLLDVHGRRLEKVLRALEKAEAAMAQAAADLDDGLASGYREVQGIDPDDPRREQKLRMLTALYEDNRPVDGDAAGD